MAKSNDKAKARAYAPFPDSDDGSPSVEATPSPPIPSTAAGHPSNPVTSSTPLRQPAPTAEHSTNLQQNGQFQQSAPSTTPSNLQLNLSTPRDLAYQAAMNRQNASTASNDALLIENQRQKEESLEQQRQRLAADRESFERQKEEFEAFKRSQQQPRSQFQSSLPPVRQFAQSEIRQPQQFPFPPIQSFGPPLAREPSSTTLYGPQPTRPMCASSNFAPRRFYHNRFPSTSSESAPPSPQIQSRQPNANAPIRRTTNSLPLLQTYNIFNNAKKTVKPATIPVFSDVVHRIHIRRSTISFQCRTGATFVVSHRNLASFMQNQLADIAIKIDCDNDVSNISSLDRQLWINFLRQTSNVTFYGHWVKNNLFHILESFPTLQQCYFEITSWLGVWMNELRRYIPVNLQTLYVDTRQSANSTFLSVLKHITLAAFDHNYRYANLFLFVTDFPNGPAFDDYLLHIHDYVSERAVVFVNLPADDAILKILRFRNFNMVATSILHPTNEEYIFFELQVENVYFTIGFLVPPTVNNALSSSKPDKKF